MVYTPEEEKLVKYCEAYKTDFDGGFHRSMVSLAEDCFNEMKKLGDKAKVRDIHKYLAAVHLVTVERMEAGFRKHLAELERLNRES
jgi:hypothetical protein